jgi:hypothetical protein
MQTGWRELVVCLRSIPLAPVQQLELGWTQPYPLRNGCTLVSFVFIPRTTCSLVSGARRAVPCRSASAHISDAHYVGSAWGLQDRRRVGRLRFVARGWIGGVGRARIGCRSSLGGRIRRPIEGAWTGTLRVSNDATNWHGCVKSNVASLPAVYSPVLVHVTCHPLLTDALEASLHSHSTSHSLSSTPLSCNRRRCCCLPTFRFHNAHCATR